MDEWNGRGTEVSADGCMEGKITISKLDTHFSQTHIICFDLEDVASIYITKHTLSNKQRNVAYFTIQWAVYL